MTDLHWVKILADNWRGRNGNSTTGDSVRNSCADELEKVAARNGILVVAQPPMQADIAQIIREGYVNGKTADEIAAEILREFER